MHERVAEIGEPAWDALLTDDSSPFMEFAWLDALEEAGCVSGRRGWLPRHVSLWRGKTLVAAAPMYAKGNSEGEFVFDHQWAALAGRLGVTYYPKLVVAVPFTPATGDRVLVAPGENRDEARAVIAGVVASITEQLGVSSAHVLFPREEEAASFEEAGYATRLGVQFHWRNRGYATFDDFLGSFGAKRRHQIRRERRLVADRGITVETRRGAALDDETLAHAYRFYLATVDKFVWGRRYLNERFFRLLRDRLGRPKGDTRQPRRASLEVVVAHIGGRVVGGAINIAKGRRLYGRYWGADEAHPFLHFEVCYYHSIAECIERGFEAFEPGAGGEHKVRRGFDPTRTWSAHRILDPRLDAIVRDYLVREKAHIERVIAGEIEDE